MLTHDDLTLLSDAPVRVALPVGQHLVYVYSAFVPIPYVTTHLCTLAQLEHVVTTQSTINPDGYYVVPETIDIGGMSLRPLFQVDMQYTAREPCTENITFTCIPITVHCSRAVYRLKRNTA
jgi:hypothetical protein